MEEKKLLQTVLIVQNTENKDILVQIRVDGELMKILYLQSNRKKEINIYGLSVDDHIEVRKIL